GWVIHVARRGSSPSIGAWSLEFLWMLEVGAWNFSAQLRHHIRQRLIHLRMVLDGHHRLDSQRRRAAIPKEGAFPGQIEQRHRVARAELLAHADAESARIRKRRFWLMARSAGERAVFRKRSFVKQLFAERNAFFGERI